MPLLSSVAAAGDYLRGVMLRRDSARRHSLILLASSYYRLSAMKFDMP